MTAFSRYQGQKIGIFGLSKTGKAAYDALKNVSDVICWDDKPAIREDFAHISISHQALVNPENQKWRELDKILLSPGLPHSHSIFKLAAAYDIPIITDIDLLYEENSQANFVAITGTNGKSTTTALIAHILNSAGFDYPVGGNLGIAALSLPLNKAGYVLELSSFQLELISTFKAKVALLLNITPDHLDRHGTMQAYINAKKKIFANLTKDCFAIINIDNDITAGIYSQLLNSSTEAKLIPTSVSKKQQVGVASAGDKIYDNIWEPIILELPLNKALQGLHNKENIVASYAACRALGLNPKSIIDGIYSFQGLPHRMQYIGNIENISFYNDSKATNADAASKSLSALDNIYWLAGGIAKEGGVGGLQPYFNRIKKAYLFGKDKELFAKTLVGKVDFQLFQSLEEAFACAFSDAKNAKTKDKNILLAPAAASYDQFQDFEHRGNVFTQLYYKMAVPTNIFR